MTRPQVSEVELVDLQRKALSCFQRVDNLAAWAWKSDAIKEAQAEQIQTAAELAREVSDEVDKLTDIVRGFTRSAE